MEILNDKQIQDILLKGSYIKQEELQQAITSAQNKNQSTIDYLISQGKLTKDIVGQAIAEHYKVDYADLNSNPPSREQVLQINAEIAKQYRIVIYSETKDSIVIATDQLEKVLPMKEQFQKALKKKLSIAFGLTEDIDSLFSYYKEDFQPKLDNLQKDNKESAKAVFIEIMRQAFSLKASDVHLEPSEEEDVLIRIRVDGILKDAGKIQQKTYDNLINRIKVLARLRLDKHFSAQDGAIRYQDDDYEADLRISIVPLIQGEKTAIRILSQYLKKIALNQLGLANDDLPIVEKTIKKPFGMILAVGPTGSGKTTTLYALLNMINSKDINITTIEDPVEYRLKGINQIQVNLETELTFAKGLRSIVRQDPDCILVGEIRDKETAEIATNAALTGHLLLSTFHANDAATAIPRLVDMGIEPFLLSSSLELIIAQRLARRICEKCRYSYEIDRDELIKQYPIVAGFYPKDQKMITMFKGKGCDVCKNTGYNGRIGIFELIQISQDMKNLILKNPSNVSITEMAKKEGNRNFFADGMKKVASGETTLEEVLRVVPVADAQSPRLNQIDQLDQKKKIKKDETRKGTKKSR